MSTPWDIDEKDFPHEGSDEDRIKFCLNYAILAQSTFNSQPWLFEIHDNHVDLYADRRAAHPVSDPDDRELTISCACALFSFRVALKHFGYRGDVLLRPDPLDEDLLARVSIEPYDDENFNDPKSKLFPHIKTRHSNRGPFKTDMPPEDHIKQLERAVTEEGCWMYICNEDERKIVASLIAEGDAIQMSQKPFRRELAAWATPTRDTSHDGMSQWAMPFTEMMRNTDPLVFRRFANDDGEAVSNKELHEGIPVLAIIGSHRGGMTQRLQAGQGLMHVLLVAESLGLSVTTLNQPVQVPDLRLRLHDEIAHTQGRAQCVLRIGYAKNPAKFNSLRKPLETVLL